MSNVNNHNIKASDLIRDIANTISNNGDFELQNRAGERLCVEIMTLGKGANQRIVFDTFVSQFNINNV